MKSLANWLQILGNFGILIGIVLVLMQLRQNEELQRVEILNQYADSYGVIEASFAGERLPEVWEKSIREPENLTLSEARILESVTWAPVLRWINLYRQAEAGILTDEDWRAEVTNDSGYYFGTPYAQAWWRRSGGFALASGFLPEEIYLIVEDRINDGTDLNPLSDYEAIMNELRSQSSGASADISGDWEIHSSVGSATPIIVRCSLQQQANELTGSCTPEMENAEASLLSGNVDGDSAAWAYDIVFNGEPGRVEFTADVVTGTGMLGVLSLSGTEAPFSALRR